MSGVTSPSDLRRFAMRCMERAQAVADPNARAAWLEMAKNWLKIAGSNERASGIKQQQQQIQPDVPPKD
jgi:hypothetical protein